MDHDRPFQHPSPPLARCRCAQNQAQILFRAGPVAQNGAFEFPIHPEPERAEPAGAPSRAAEPTPASRFDAATAMAGQRTALLDALRAAKRPAAHKA